MDEEKIVESQNMEETAPSGEPTPHPPDPAESTSGVDYLLTPDDTFDGERIMHGEDESVKWAYLAAESRSRRVLTGVVSGLEPLENHNWIVSVDFCGIRVVIPLREMVLNEWPEGEEPIPSVMSKIRRMLGATVDFVPVAVDAKNEAVIGSRKEAMLIRQKQYYGSGRIYPGMRVTCRVIGVSENGVTLEAAGVDSNVRSRNVSQKWFSSALELYGVGDTVAARVMDLKYDATRKRYSVVLSIKEAEEKSDEAVLKKLVKGSCYFGTVTGVREGNVYVRLRVGCNAATHIYRSREMPARDDTVSFEVRRIDEDAQLVFGVITRIIKRHPTLR